MIPIIFKKKMDYRVRSFNFFNREKNLKMTYNVDKGPHKMVLSVYVSGVLLLQKKYLSGDGELKPKKALEHLHDSFVDSIINIGMMGLYTHRLKKEIDSPESVVKDS